VPEAEEEAADGSISLRSDTMTEELVSARINDEDDLLTDAMQSYAEVVR